MALVINTFTYTNTALDILLLLLCFECRPFPAHYSFMMEDQTVSFRGCRESEACTTRQTGSKSQNIESGSPMCYHPVPLCLYNIFLTSLHGPPHFLCPSEFRIPPIQPKVLRQRLEITPQTPVPQPL